MNIDVQPSPEDSNIICVAIDGRIDAYTVERVEEELNSLIRIGSAQLICDLSAVEFVSSSGFKAFRRVIKFAREQDGNLKFCGLTPEVSRLFNGVGFTNQTGIFSSREAAVSNFGSGQSGSESRAPQTATGLKALRRIIGLEKEAESEPEIDDSALKQTQIFTKNSSLKETVIFSANQKTAAENDADTTAHFASLEPVSVTLPSETSHFQHLSQLLGTIGSLVGFSSVELVNLNVAVLEVCRTMAKELKPDETFSLKIDSARPGFRVTATIPRENYDIYSHIKPNSELEGKEWLLNYVDEVDSSNSGEKTEILLILND